MPPLIRPLHKDFNFIIVSVMDGKTYHFYVRDLSTANKNSDIAFFRINKKPS